MALKRKRTDEYHQESTLHTLGFVVYRGAVNVTERTVTKLCELGQNNARTIFNHHEDRPRNDHKRRQAGLNRQNRLVADLRAQIGEFLYEFFPNHTPNDWVVIHSRPGCGDQAAHCDYVPDQLLAAASDATFPLAALTAVMPGTRIHVWPQSIKLAYTNPVLLSRRTTIQRVTVNLEPGDVLVFRGDLVHAGASYTEENVRVHAFLDTTTVPRDPNRTWLVHKDGSAEMRRIIKP